MAGQTAAKVRGLWREWTKTPLRRFVRLYLYCWPVQMSARGILRLMARDTVTQAQFFDDLITSTFAALFMAAGILLFGKYNRIFRS
jgi:hypothetical protein